MEIRHARDTDWVGIYRPLWDVLENNPGSWLCVEPDAEDSLPGTNVATRHRIAAAANAHYGSGRVSTSLGVDGRILVKYTPLRDDDPLNLR